MKFEIPRPLKVEHEELHGELVEAKPVDALVLRRRQSPSSCIRISSRKRNMHCRPSDCWSLSQRASSRPAWPTC